ATRLEDEMTSGQSWVSTYDAVIATTPSHIFTRLAPPLPEAYASKLTNVTYLSAVLMVLALDRPLSHMYWLNVADRSMPFVGIIEQTNLVDTSLYGGKHVVYFSNYPSLQNPLYQMTGEELLESFLPHLRRINPGFNPSWIEEYYHHKVDAAQPIIGVNYSRRIPDLRTPIRDLYLANTTQIYPEDRGTNYSVRLGKEVAGLALKDHTL
ncbi:MAG: FAD-dependent oxidoreductase, partial [Dehalococcoidia bacterium]|nr:FAD-dependent oxidoreductase [Dehalococcoidia bacterium]